MTIPFGRHLRLVLTVQLTPPRLRPSHAPAAVAHDDRRLALLTSGPTYDIDHARWEALSLIYGRTDRR